MGYVRVLDYRDWFLFKMISQFLISVFLSVFLIYLLFSDKFTYNKSFQLKFAHWMIAMDQKFDDAQNQSQ